MQQCCKKTIRSKLVYFVYDPRAESGDNYDVYDSDGGTARRQSYTTYTITERMTAGIRRLQKA